jgi:hypothetical protein
MRSSDQRGVQRRPLADGRHAPESDGRPTDQLLPSAEEAEQIRIERRLSLQEAGPRLLVPVRLITRGCGRLARRSLGVMSVPDQFGPFSSEKDCSALSLVMGEWSHPLMPREW